jgi:two-component system NtrC family response regulator
MGFVWTTAVIMAEGSRLTPEDLELDSTASPTASVNLREAREVLERDLIQKALSRNRGHLTRAASDLGISRPTIYELMEKLGIGR